MVRTWIAVMSLVKASPFSEPEVQNPEINHPKSKGSSLNESIRLFPELLSNIYQIL